MRTRSLARRLSGIEDKVLAQGVVVPDDLEEALRDGRVRRRHLDKLFRQHGSELEQFLIANALAQRKQRMESGSSDINFMSGYAVAVDILSYAPDETLDGMCFKWLQRTAQSPLHELQESGRFFPTDPIVRKLQMHLAMYVLKTPDALELRTEIHSWPVVPTEHEEAPEVDPDLYYSFEDQPECTLMTSLFPWLEVWLPRRRDHTQKGWQPRATLAET